MCLLTFSAPTAGVCAHTGSDGAGVWPARRHVPETGRQVVRVGVRRFRRQLRLLDVRQSRQPRLTVALIPCNQLDFNSDVDKTLQN